jgi:hypothetical protein
LTTHPTPGCEDENERVKWGEVGRKMGVRLKRGGVRFRYGVVE